MFNVPVAETSIDIYPDHKGTIDAFHEFLPAGTQLYLKPKPLTIERIKEIAIYWSNSKYVEDRERFLVDFVRGVETELGIE